MLAVGLQRSAPRSLLEDFFYTGGDGLDELAVLVGVEVDSVPVARPDYCGGVEVLAPVLLGEAPIMLGKPPGLLAGSIEHLGHVRERRGGEIKSTTGAPPPSPHPLFETISASSAAPCAMSEAELPKRFFRSLVPSMSATRSTGLCDSRQGLR